MDLDALRTLINTTPGPTAPDIDGHARAWLASAGMEITTGDGDPVVLFVLAVDEDLDFRAFALPGALIDEVAHRDLAALHGAAFEHHFTADLEPRQFAGAFRVCGGTTIEPDVFSDQIEDLREEVEGEGEAPDYDALIASAGSWNEYRIASGAALGGPVSHVYSATLCM